jgi:hypothetical protein
MKEGFWVKMGSLTDKVKSKRGEAFLSNSPLGMGRLKGRSPFNTLLPLSFQGEGDKGGEVDKQPQ